MLIAVYFIVKDILHDWALTLVNVTGLTGAFMLATMMRIQIGEFDLTPKFDVGVILASTGMASLIALFGALLPAWWLSRINLSGLLRAE